MKQLNVRLDDEKYERLKSTKRDEQTWEGWLLESAALREEPEGLE